ncbi:MAG: hypothetical protein ABI200_06125 [Gaiellales bacterium]
MSTARSAFTEAIEDHLALKKQNSPIESAMPLARYDVGDPLDRYPGGPNRNADSSVVIAEDVTGEQFDAFDQSAPGMPAPSAFGPSPEQAMEAATALEHAFADRPFEPLNGMAPMLSLVEDIDEDDASQNTGAFDVAATSPASDVAHGDVLRFPGGVGPREESAQVGEQQTLIADAPLQVETHSFAGETTVPTAGDSFGDELDAPTGEQPVLVIDTDEPLAGSDWAEPAAPVRTRKAKPRFFGIGRKKSEKNAGDEWFQDDPRDFNWD